MTSRRASLRQCYILSICPYRFLLSVATSIFLLNVCELRAFGQISSPADEEVIRVQTNLITVPVFVTDARGHYVAHLTKDDFNLFDNGRRVEINYFAQGTDRVALVYALDASGSARDTITQQRETALALFSRFGRTSRISVIHFSDRPQVALTFTNDARTATKAFSFSANANRRTAIFDAALAAVRSFDTSGSDKTERRIIILLSDGLDTVSASRPPAVIREALARNASFYVIHLPLFIPRDGRLVPRPTAKGFRELAEQTGGRYFTIGDAQSALNPRAEYDLSPVFQAIFADLQSQYVLGYYAIDPTYDGKTRSIEVRLNSSKRKLRVRTLRHNYVLSKQIN